MPRDTFFTLLAILFGASLGLAAVNPLLGAAGVLTVALIAVFTPSGNTPA